MLTDQQRVRSELLSMLGTPATDIDAARRDALRSALRRWRSAIAPEHVGLPARRRRRSGLSGADVAECGTHIVQLCCIFSPAPDYVLSRLFRLA